MSFPLTRFDAVSRRSFLRGAAAVGAAVIVPACSNDDSAELGTETIAARMELLSGCGLDGLLLSWIEYEPGIRRFAAEVEPLLAAKGLRSA